MQVVCGNRLSKRRGIRTIVLMFTLFVVAFAIVACGYNYSDSNNFENLMSQIDQQRSQSVTAVQQILDLNSKKAFDYCAGNYYENAKSYYTQYVQGNFNTWLDRIAEEAQNGQALNQSSGDSDTLTNALKANYAFTTWANQVTSVFNTYLPGLCAPAIQISDPANMLYPSPLEGAVSGFPYPISIYTTNTYTGTDGQFDNWARSQETSLVMIVIAIKHNVTGNYTVTIVGGSDLLLQEGVYQTAQTAFVNKFNSGGSLTDATIAAIQSLYQSIQQLPQTSVPSSNTSTAISGGVSPVTSNGGYLQAMLPREEVPPELEEEASKISVDDISNALNALGNLLGLVSNDASNSSSNNNSQVANDIETYHWKDFDCVQTTSSSCSG